jgi:3-dehydroquinate synthase
VKTIRVLAKRSQYPIWIGQDLIHRTGELFTKEGLGSPPVVVTNETVWDLHGRALQRALRPNYGRVAKITIGDGERFKNRATLARIHDGLFELHADRHSWILAFGGGVVGDIAGFAAATYMRGISVVHIPTTLLSQVDSAIGGKVGIDVPQGKNLIGAFHQPRAVLSDPTVLKTLPERELAAGLYEVVKYGAIRSASLMQFLDKHLEKILSGDGSALERIVAECSGIKADVVSADEKEAGLRMILNFGHTVGHALESATHYRRFRHGEAVAWGMVAALGFGSRMGLAGEGEASTIIRLIHRVERLPGLHGIEFREVWNALERDKKFRGGKIRLILLRRIGESEIRGDIDPERLRKYLRTFLRENERSADLSRQRLT